MGYVLKGSKYRLVSNRSFELPLPIKYELFKEDLPVAEYEVSADETVSFRILTKYKEDMLTPVYRQLDMSDIYYFLSSRVFQDNTPYTPGELSLLGLDRYNVYDIVRKTRGITPFDKYWLKFEGDSSDYENALKNFNELMNPAVPNDAESAAFLEMPAPQAPASAAPAPVQSDIDLHEVLGQHKLDIGAKFEQHAPPPPEPEPVSNTMSADEIEALLLKSGLIDIAPPEPEPSPAPETPSGGSMSQEDIEKMLAGVSSEPAPEPSSGGKMSQEDIEKMLAGVSSEPGPAPELSSGGKMSQEDIEKMLAGVSSEPEPAPEPSSGGKMSQEDIEKMLAGVSSEPGPAPEPSSGGKMSQEDIEKMLAGVSSEPEPAPEPSSGGKMSQEDIEKMLAGAASAVEAAAEAVAETPAETAPSGGKMSQADIEALLSGMADDVKS